MPKFTILMNGEAWPGIGAGVEALLAGRPALDVCEAAIGPTESDPAVRTVGFGGAPNALGVMELDASAMDGNTLQTGSVGAVQGIMHPFSLARRVLERLPHVMLVGEGAQRYALECGYKLENILSSDAKKDFEIWKADHKSQNLVDHFQTTQGLGSHGTVTCLVIDRQGSFGGGVSTSGWDYKYPGRLGDSPIIGAGLYIDRRFGGASCTHCGENAIRTGLARSVVLYMKKGASVKEAVSEGIEDLGHLQGGYQGQVVIYAFDKEGAYHVARRYTKEAPSYYHILQEGMKSFEKREVGT